MFLKSHFASSTYNKRMGMAMCRTSTGSINNIKNQKDYDRL